jgi:uncharacterized membrane protein YcaP (DUF421 family)
VSVRYGYSRSFAATARCEMFDWLVGSWRSLGYVALSAALIYLSTVVSVRWFGERRTLAQLTIFDFAVAVALGAIIARTATTTSPGYLAGLTAVVVLLLVHDLVSWVRIHVPWAAWIVAREPIVLVRDGEVDRDALLRAHMTDDDLSTELREHGVGSLRDVRLGVLESRGAFSVVTGGPVDPALVPGAGAARRP